MGEAAKTDGRIRRGEVRREQILNAAVRHFAARGYEAARLADIARDAGMTDAGLIHHFPTKRDLFVAVIERREEAYAPVVRGASSVAELFHAFGEAVRAAAAEPEYLRFRAMLGGAGPLTDHPATAHLALRLEQALELLLPVLQAGVETGELLPGSDPYAIALHVLALNDGLRAQWVQFPGRIDYPAVFEAGLRALYRSAAGAELPASPPTR